MEPAMAQILTAEELRRVLPEPRQTTLAKILPALDAQGQAFIGRSPFALLATRSADGALDVSPKGDMPGFIRIEDDRSLLIPERAGNNLAFGLQNILATQRIALIFMLPGTSETFRVSGRAAIYDDADLLAELGTPERPALLALRVSIDQCYFHCARAVLRSKLWDPAAWGERVKVSFGQIIAPRVGGDAAMIDAIDARIDTVMATSLWKNT
jgi:uncharacterized protein